MSPAACLGYSHVLGEIPGGQAEFMRVPFADVNTLKIPETLSDDQVVFLSDIFPTGWMAAENCDIQSGETVAVWGCGPVGQFAIASAWLQGASRVIAIDWVTAQIARIVDVHSTRVGVSGAIVHIFTSRGGAFSRFAQNWTTHRRRSKG